MTRRSSQGPINIHELEHLGTQDRGIVMFRRFVRRGIQAVEKGQDPKGFYMRQEDVPPSFANDRVVKAVGDWRRSGRSCRAARLRRPRRRGLQAQPADASPVVTAKIEGIVMSEWVKVAALSELEPDYPKHVKLGSIDVALYLVEGSVFATDNMCSHAFALLSDGHARRSRDHLSVA